MLDVKRLLYHICSKLSNIGVHKNAVPDAITTQSGKFYTAASIELEPGTWILMGHVWFEYKNTTGFRRGYFTIDKFTNGTGTAPSNYAMAGYQEFAASAFGSGRADVKAGPIYVNVLNETTPFRLVAYQGSGVNMSVNGRIYAVKVV